MFDALLSNKKMKEQLTAAVKADMPMHAYLFCGAAGSGKKTAAELLAYEIIGASREKVLRGCHPDVVTIHPLEGKKLISVDQIREMRADAFVRPNEGRRKIYIIDGVHLMNDAGQNALLTVLEQPPSFAVFILLSESRQKVLPTVISRCAVYDMEYVEPPCAAEYLKTVYPNKDLEQLKTAVRAAGGNIGLAKSFLGSEEFEKYSADCEKLVVSAMSSGEYTASRIISGMSKDELCGFLPVLAIYLRDLAVYSAMGNIDDAVFCDSILKNKQLFDKINLNLMYDSIRACESAIGLINANISPALAAAKVVILLCGGKNID